MKLTHTSVRGGVWTAILTAKGPDAPSVEVRLGDERLSDVTVNPLDDAGGRFELQVRIPPGALSEDGGLISVADPATGAVIGMLQVSVGTPPDDDLRAEVTRLRQEMELVKDVLRRQGRS